MNDNQKLLDVTAIALGWIAAHPALLVYSLTANHEGWVTILANLATFATLFAGKAVKCRKHGTSEFYSVDVAPGVTVQAIRTEVQDEPRTVVL